MKGGPAMVLFLSIYYCFVFSLLVLGITKIKEDVKSSSLKRIFLETRKRAVDLIISAHIVPLIIGFFLLHKACSLPSNLFSKS